MKNLIVDNKRFIAVDGLPPLREVIAAHNLRAEKSLGQNFLLDMNITDKIVREAMLRDGGSWAGVHGFEIGSGPGGLTRALLKSDLNSVTAIEFDKRAVRVLESLVDVVQGDLEIVNQDALKFDITQQVEKHPRVIVANLPYNIATPLLIKWLGDIRKDVSSYKSMSLMFQKEVADRIIAKTGTKHYGRLSVISQWLCNIDKIYDLPSSAFIPPPKVNSAVVYFSPKIIDKNSPDFNEVERVTARAFNQRRKMIRSSLKDYMEAIDALGIDPQKRAENLSVEEFVKIAKFSLSRLRNH